MRMRDKIDDLQHRRDAALQGGGADKLEKHRKSGRLTARERIAALVETEKQAKLDALGEAIAEAAGGEYKGTPKSVKSILGKVARKRPASGARSGGNRTVRSPAGTATCRSASLVASRSASLARAPCA